MLNHVADKAQETQSWTFWLLHIACCKCTASRTAPPCLFYSIVGMPCIPFDEHFTSSIKTDETPFMFSSLLRCCADALNFGPAGVPLLQMMPSQQVQRPRLLICGEEGSGQSHLGPALLYALEGLPVHALGLPSLLSDASARSVSFNNECMKCAVSYSSLSTERTCQM